MERAAIWVRLRIRAAEKGHNASGWRAEILEGIEPWGLRVGAGQCTQQCHGPDDVRSSFRNAGTPRAKLPRGSYPSVLLRPKACAYRGQPEELRLQYGQVSHNSHFEELLCCPWEAFEVPFRRSGYVSKRGLRTPMKTEGYCVRLPSNRVLRTERLPPSSGARGCGNGMRFHGGMPISWRWLGSRGVPRYSPRICGTARSSAPSGSATTSRRRRGHRDGHRRRCRHMPVCGFSGARPASGGTPGGSATSEPSPAGPPPRAPYQGASPRGRPTTLAGSAPGFGVSFCARPL